MAHTTSKWWTISSSNEVTNKLSIMESLHIDVSRNLIYAFTFDIVKMKHEGLAFVYID